MATDKVNNDSVVSLGRFGGGHIDGRRRRRHAQAVDEVILATSPTLEGEATASWLGAALRNFSVKITRIATGVPAGSDIDYADEVTMTRALEGRRDL